MPPLSQRAQDKLSMFASTTAHRACIQDCGRPMYSSVMTASLTASSRNGADSQCRYWIEIVATAGSGSGIAKLQGEDVGDLGVGVEGNDLQVGVEVDDHVAALEVRGGERTHIAHRYERDRRGPHDVDIANRVIAVAELMQRITDRGFDLLDIHQVNSSGRLSTKRM